MARRGGPKYEVLHPVTGKPVTVPWNPDPENLERSLYAVVENAVEGRTVNDLMFEVLLKCNVPLDVEIVKEKVGENTVIVAGGGGRGATALPAGAQGRVPPVLMMCLDGKIPAKVADEMVRLRKEKYVDAQDMRVVFRDGGLTDMDKANAIMILTQAGVEESAIMSV